MIVGSECQSDAQIFQYSDSSPLGSRFDDHCSVVDGGGNPTNTQPLLPPSAWDLFQHKVHNYCGMTIGVLIALRVALRFARGSWSGFRLSNWKDHTAAFVHWGLYAALAAQAFTGFVAAYYWGRRQQSIRPSGMLPSP